MLRELLDNLQQLLKQPNLQGDETHTRPVCGGDGILRYKVARTPIQKLYEVAEWFGKRKRKRSRHSEDIIVTGLDIYKIILIFDNDNMV